MRRTVWFTPDPARLTWAVVPSVAAKVVALKAASGSSGARDGSLKWETRLDGVLRNVSAQVDAASAQASVLLITLLAVAVLVLLLAADLLVHRRAPALAAARQRGMSLPVIGGELLLESAVVALLATAAGLGLARAVAPGVSWEWIAPVVVTAVAAGPAFGTLTAARATRDRRVPANRSARRWARNTVRLRRAALESGVLVAAVAAVVALYQRGIWPPSLPAATWPSWLGLGGGGPLPASAPALWRARRQARAGYGAAPRGWASCSSGPCGRAVRWRCSAPRGRSATSARVLPLLVLVTSVALASFALTLDAAVGHGTAAGPLASGLLRLAWVSA